MPASVINLGAGGVAFGSVFPYCYDLVRITVDPDNPASKSVDGVL